MPATAPTMRCASTGGEIAARVVGEGANLGVTQARAASNTRSRAGRINTDAIDNSAGVDTSDHEVNLKILLNAVGGGQRLRPAPAATSSSPR